MFFHFDLLHLTKDPLIINVQEPFSVKINTRTENLQHNSLSAEFDHKIPINLCTTFCIHFFKKWPVFTVLFKKCTIYHAQLFYPIINVHSEYIIPITLFIAQLEPLEVNIKHDHFWLFLNMPEDHVKKIYCQKENISLRIFLFDQSS